MKGSTANLSGRPLPSDTEQTPPPSGDGTTRPLQNYRRYRPKTANPTPGQRSRLRENLHTLPHIGVRIIARSRRPPATRSQTWHKRTNLARELHSPTRTVQVTRRYRIWWGPVTPPKILETFMRTLGLLCDSYLLEDRCSGTHKRLWSGMERIGGRQATGRTGEACLIETKYRKCAKNLRAHNPPSPLDLPSLWKDCRRPPFPRLHV